MTALELQLRATGPDPFVVLGKRLVPLCIGHLPLLAKAECGVIAGPGELGLAVLICSRPPAQVVAFLNSRLFELRLAFWRRRLGVWDFAEHKAAFEAYLKYHTELPEVIFKGDGETAIPFWQRLRMLLIARLHYNPATVDGVSYLQAMWDFVSYAEFEGWAAVQDFSGDDIEREMAALDLEAIAAAGERILKKEEGPGHA